MSDAALATDSLPQLYRSIFTIHYSDRIRPGRFVARTDFHIEPSECGVTEMTDSGPTGVVSHLSRRVR
jgi:hypothetical protein